MDGGSNAQNDRLNVAIQGLKEKVQPSNPKKRHRRSKLEMQIGGITGGLSKTQEHRLLSIMQKHASKDECISWKSISKQATFAGIGKDKLKALGNSLLRKHQQAADRKRKFGCDSDEFTVLTEEVFRLQQQLTERDRFAEEVNHLNVRCAALEKRQKEYSRMALDAETHAKLLADELHNAERDRDVTLERMQEVEEKLQEFEESRDYGANSEAVARAYAERNAALEDLSAQSQHYEGLIYRVKQDYENAMSQQYELERTARRLAYEKSEYRTAYERTVEEKRQFERGMMKAQKGIDLLDMCTGLDREIKILSDRLKKKGKKMMQL